MRAPLILLAVLSAAFGDVIYDGGCCGSSQGHGDWPRQRPPPGPAHGVELRVLRDAPRAVCEVLEAAEPAAGTEPSWQPIDFGGDPIAPDELRAWRRAAGRYRLRVHECDGAWASLVVDVPTDRDVVVFFAGCPAPSLVRRGPEPPGPPAYTCEAP